MNKRGFTLVELLIGSMIGAIILMSVYVAFSAATKYWNKSNSATSAQQTARFASDHMSKNLKTAFNDGTNTYTITTDAASKTQTLKYQFSSNSGDIRYYHYFFPDYSDTARQGKIYWGTSAIPTSTDNSPLTGDNVAGADAVKIFAKPASGSVNPNQETGIFSTDGTNYAQTSPARAELVYIDFIAQDYSSSARSQTASGQAQGFEIRTAATYPHL